MRNPINEDSSVQTPLIKYVTEIGWNEIPSNVSTTTHRKGEGGIFFYDVLAAKLIELNLNVINETNVEEIIKRIENVRNNLEGNAEVLAWTRGLRSVFVPSQKREINVRLIDFENIHNNIFHVTREWRYTNGRHLNKVDVTFVINGIPVLIVETKSAHIKDAIEKGYNQIRRYHNETPEMMVRPQIYGIPNILYFYYGVTWNLERKNLFNWKDEINEEQNYEIKVKRFFEPGRILKVLKDHIIFFKRNDELSKIILRQHQIRAVDKILDRSLDGQKRRGLIWHTQGSGKTLTMITASRELFERPEFEKPTIIMIVDRNELESQLFQNLVSVGFERHKGMEITDSKSHLQELLEADYRGVIVSTIHKFDGIRRGIILRKNVFVLVDEAHRSTTGDFAIDLFSSVPNATFIGFTGTPIDKISYGKGTFKVFGKDDEKGYLDKYSIAESIKDGTTVPLNYSLVPNDLNIKVPKALLDSEFLSLTETQGVSDIRELNRLLDRSVKLKTFLKSVDRIKKVTDYIIDHFQNNVEPLGYKAFVVAVDRQACALYKTEFDKLLPANYTKAVYSKSNDDDDESNEIIRHYLSEEEEKNVRKSFTKSNELPKILIVTEKLLTGFDAPILYCMYLDKPMRDHTLLQAIARVNRPYEDDSGEKKPSGLVVDFIGIFENIQKALAFDSDIVASVIKNIDVLKDRFEKLITSEQTNEYLEVLIGSSGDKVVEHAIEFFKDKEKREEFFTYFKELEMLYEIISPDSFLGQYVERYGKIAYLYQLTKNRKNIIIGKELRNKTEELIRKNISIQRLQQALPIYKIDETTLNIIRDDDSSDHVKVINLSKSIKKAVIEEEEKQPYLIPLGERADSILEYYDDRQIKTREALDELSKLVTDYNEANKERLEKGYDINTFSIYWYLKKEGIDNIEKISIEINNVIENCINYKENAEEMRTVKTEIYKILLDSGLKDFKKAKKLTQGIIELKRGKT